LHRKELFVPHDYPGREVFEKLTAFEVSLGLLDEFSNIGLEKPWNELLMSRGYEVRGNEIMSL
jgi:hypothetical protein